MLDNVRSRFVHFDESEKSASVSRGEDEEEEQASFELAGEDNAFFYKRTKIDK